MSTIVDVYHATVPAAAAERLLEVRGPAIAGLRERCPGLRRAELIRVDDTRWIDLVVWDSAEARDAAAAHVDATPELRELHALAGVPTAHEHGTLEHAA